MLIVQRGERSADQLEPASTDPTDVLGDRNVRDVRNLVTLLQINAGVIERSLAIPRDPFDLDEVRGG